MPTQRRQVDIPSRFRLVTAPAVEPVTLAEAKAHVRVTLTNDDASITALITAAREMCEAAVNRSFINTTWDYSLDDFPWVDCGSPSIKVPKGDLVSVSSVSYINTSGVSTALVANTDYLVVTGAPGLIFPTPNREWPEVQTDRLDAVTIRCVVGYGALASSVPACVKQAILLLVGDWYRNREQTVLGTITAELPTGVQRLLNPVRWGDYW